MLGGLHVRWWAGRAASQRSFYKCAAHLPVKVLPGVLRHQSEQREKGPTEWVKTGVAIIRVLSHSDTGIPLWTAPAKNTASMRFGKCRWIQCDWGTMLTQRHCHFHRATDLVCQEGNNNFLMAKEEIVSFSTSSGCRQPTKSNLIYIWKVQEPTKYVFYGKGITVMIVWDQMFHNIM